MLTFGGGTLADRGNGRTAGGTKFGYSDGFFLSSTDIFYITFMFEFV